MLEFPIAELITPEEQVAVARAVAIMASRDNQVSDSKRHFVEDLMAQMMLLPEERDLVRREFTKPTDLMHVARTVQHREARIFLFYQAVCAALADNKLVDGEMDAKIVEPAQKQKQQNTVDAKKLLVTLIPFFNTHSQVKKVEDLMKPEE